MIRGRFRRSDKKKTSSYFTFKGSSPEEQPLITENMIEDDVPAYSTSTANKTPALEEGHPVWEHAVDWSQKCPNFWCTNTVSSFQQWRSPRGKTGTEYSERTIVFRQQLKPGFYLDYSVDHTAIHDRWVAKGYQAVNRDAIKRTVIGTVELASFDCAGCNKISFRHDMLVFKEGGEEEGKGKGGWKGRISFGGQWVMSKKY